MTPSPLLFESPSSEFRVVARSGPIDEMHSMCRASPSKETGGILIGFYSEDRRTANVIEITGPPPDSERTRDQFKRGVTGLRSLLLGRWQATRQTHYLGEWHYHTAHVPRPSAQDERQMRAVAVDPRYGCAEPLLMIICPGTVSSWSIGCFAFPRGRSCTPLHPIVQGRQL